jgi:hypothetical protein
MKRFFMMIVLSCINTISFSKVYEITIEACEVGTSCSRCVERNKITFDVDASAKTVVAKGTAFDGLAVHEVLKDCQVQDESNWSCGSAYVIFQARTGMISLSNKSKENRQGQHEVCHVK